MSGARAESPAERPAPSPAARLVLSLLLPPLLGIVLQGLGVYGIGLALESTRVLLYLGIGAGAWSLALRSGRLAAAGLRGRRPLLFGITVGMLLGLPLLIARMLFAPLAGIAPPDANALRAVFFEMLFAGLCGQLWLFGVLYNAVRDWAAARSTAAGTPAANLVTGNIWAVVATGALFELTYFDWLGLAQPWGAASAEANAARLAYLLALGLTLAIGRWRADSVPGVAFGWGLIVWITWDMLRAPAYGVAPAGAWLLAAATQLVLVWVLWPRAAVRQEEAHGTGR